MKCNNCGAELAEGVKFCGSCGTAVQAPVEQPVAEPKPTETPATETTEVKEKAKKANPLALIGAKIKPLTEKAKPIVEKCKPFVLKNKLWFAGGACLLVLLITALIIISACTSGNGFTPVKHAINVYATEDGVMFSYDNKKMIKTNIEATEISSSLCSLDGNICAFLTSDGKLGIINGKKAALIAEDVSDYTISANGKGIAYVTVEKEDKTAELYLYNVSKKKSVSIQSDFVLGEFTMKFAVSPDGKSVAYYKYDEDDKSFTLMYFNGSKSSKVTSNKVELIGLSNKGKYIYAVATDEEGEHTLYSYNTKGDKQKIGGCSMSTFNFNEDHTQILYNDGTKTMISTKAKEPVKISSNRASILLPSSSVAQNVSGILSLGEISFYDYLNYFYDMSIKDLTDESQYIRLWKLYEEFCSSSANKISTIPCDTLFNKVYTCEKDGQTSAWLIKKNTDKSVRLVNNIYDWEIDESYEYLYYTDKDDNLMVLKVSQGERATDKAKQIAEDVDSFVVTSNRSRVYFTSDDALYSCNGKNGKSKKTVAAENVSDTIVLNSNDVCYYSVEGDVYATNNGKKGKMVVQEGHIWGASANGVVYIISEDGMFASKTSKKPTKIYTE